MQNIFSHNLSVNSPEGTTCTLLRAKPVHPHRRVTATSAPSTCVTPRLASPAHVCLFLLSGRFRKRGEGVGDGKIEATFAADMSVHGGRRRGERGTRYAAPGGGCRVVTLEWSCGRERGKIKGLKTHLPPPSFASME